MWAHVKGNEVDLADKLKMIPVVYGMMKVADLEFMKVTQWASKDALKISFLSVHEKAGVFFILRTDEQASTLIETVGTNHTSKEDHITEIRPVNAASLAVLNPEVFFVIKDGLDSTGGIEDSLVRAGVQNTEAGKKPRVFSNPEGLVQSFAQQSGDTVQAIVKAQYGVDE
ncbi:MAG: hypothetical protein Q4P66_07495 [Actinomycetaceae bacterium]|nr:hypothetical protein [Actinomycetaceae bacterium]